MSDTHAFGPLLLRQAVAMTRDARVIVEHAGSIEMTALNSVFAARHAGTTGGGFGVISKELRGFSRELAEQMDALANAVTAVVADLADILKQSRRNRLMTQASAGDEVRQRLTAALQRQTARLAQEIARARSSWTAIARIVQRARRLCGTGLHLARNARLEACQMGGMTATLTQVASDIAEAIGKILTLLDQWAQSKEAIA